MGGGYVGPDASMHTCQASHPAPVSPPPLPYRQPPASGHQFQVLHRPPSMLRQMRQHCSAESTPSCTPTTSPAITQLAAVMQPSQRLEWASAPGAPAAAASRLAPGGTVTLAAPSCRYRATCGGRQAGANVGARVALHMVAGVRWYDSTTHTPALAHQREGLYLLQRVHRWREEGVVWGEGARLEHSHRG